MAADADDDPIIFAPNGPATGPGCGAVSVTAGQLSVTPSAAGGTCSVPVLVTDSPFGPQLPTLNPWPSISATLVFTTPLTLPAVTALAPASGPVGGGNPVVISGTFLTGATAVSFGSTAAAGFTVDSATQITAIAPASAAPGTVNVQVTTPAGASATTGTADDYTYGVSPPSANLRLALADNPDPVVVGGTLTYTLTVTNDGPSGIVAGDTFSIAAALPAGLSGCSYTPSAGTFSPGTITPGSNGTGTWTGVAISGSGGTATLTIACTVTSAAAASVSHTATVLPPSGVTDPNCSGSPVTCSGNNTATASTTVNRPQLSLSKTASAPSFAVGTPASFTLRLDNSGTAATTAVSTISDPIPTGLTIGTLPAGCTAAGQTVSCTVAAGLAVSGNTSFVIPVTATVAAAASVTNTATVSGGGDTTCPAATRCSSSVTVSVIGTCAAFSFPYTLAGADNAARVANLRSAIQCANLNGTADTIDLNGQTVTLSDAFADYTGLTGLPQVTSVMTLGNGTIRREGTAPDFRLIAMTATAELTLEEITLRDGRQPENGMAGAVLNDGGRLTLLGSSVIGNQAGSAGAISHSAGPGPVAQEQAVLTIVNSTLSGNSASRGGGGAVSVARGRLRVVNSSFTNNVSNPPEGNAAGAMLVSAVLDSVIVGSTFTGNSARLAGALHIGSVVSPTQVYGSVFSGNEASTVGGAIALSGGLAGGGLTLANSLVTGNRAATGGGVIHLGSTVLTIINSTIAGNQAATGGGIHRESGTVTISNSVIWGNSSNTLTGSTISYSLVEGGFAGAGNLDADPLFVAPVAAASAPTTAGDYRLQNYSPAADAGNNALVPIDNYDVNGNSNTTEEAPDLAGNQRRYNDTGVTDTGAGTAPIVDLGAFERQTDSGEVDYCVLQFPASFTAAAGATSPLIFGRIYEDDNGILTASPGANPGITAQVGFGPAGSDPRNSNPTWRWSNATFNVQVGNDDEYRAGFTVPFAPTGTQLAYTYRFSLDGGANYTYCDTDGNGTNPGLSFSTASLGQLTISPGGLPSLSINDVSQPEGNSGTSNFVFTVSLSGPSLSAVSFDITTADNTATVAGGDYLAASTTGVVIPAGQTSASFTVAVNGDITPEASETFFVNVTNVVGAGVTDGQGQGTITNDDSSAGIMVTPTTGLVTTEAGGTATFTVVLTSQPTADVSIGLSSSDTTEGAVSPTGLTFTSANWNTPQTVTVTGVDDPMVDGNVAYSIVTAAATSTDPAYAGFNAADVSVSNTDNDEAGVVLMESGGSTTVTENGATDNYTLVLTSQPGADVTIAITGTADATVSPTSLRFTGSNWNTPQVVTVAAVNDFFLDDDLPAVLTHGASSSDGAYGGIAIANVSVTVTDNEALNYGIVAPGFVTSSSGLESVAAPPILVFGTLNGSGTGARAIEYGFDVPVSASGGTATGGVDYVLNPLVASFTPAATFSGANTLATVSLAIVDDAVDEANETVPMAIAANELGTSGSLDAKVFRSPVPQFQAHTYTINDDDSAGLAVAITGADTAVTEGGATDTYTLALTSQPTANVTVAINPNGQLTTSPTSVVFTQANWNVAQTVTVTAVDDLIAEGSHGGSVSHAVTSADASYNGLSVSGVTATITDNDVAGVTVSPTTGLTTTEAGGTATFTVVLNTQPTANVSIGLTSSDTTEGTVSPGGLTFTQANWNVAQTVTVTGVDDLVVDGSVGYSILTAAATSTDSAYGGFNAADVSVTNTDNDEAGVILTESGGSTTVTEGGATDSYTLVLTSQPTANVTVTVTPNAQLTTSPTSVVFTPTNWNVSQTVTVTAVDDAVAEGSHSGSVSHTVTSTDTTYSGITVSGVTATITDNDNAGVTVAQSGGSTAVTEGGATDTYTLVLTSQPTANVTVTVTPNAQLTTSPTSVVFTQANWNVAQTITVSAVDDAIAEGTHNGSVSHTVASTDTTYSGITVSGVTATITDNDVAGVVITENSGTTNDNRITVTEGGAGSRFAVVLTSRPTSEVQVSMTFNATLIRAGSPAPANLPVLLTFTGANWNVPQTVNVEAVNDNVVTNVGSTNLSLAVGSVDPNYLAIPTQPVSPVVVTIIEDDVAGVTVTQSGGNTSVTEGGVTDSYTLVLTSQPTANVVIALSSGTQLTATPSPLTFTAANWNVAQTVTVTAVDDAIAEGTHSGSVSHTVSSADANYQGRLVDSVSATITDNDVAGVTVTQSGGNTAATEGGATDTVSVVLTSQPLANVTVTVTPNAQLTVSPSPLTFTAANWNVAQDVTVTAANDAVVEGNHSGTLGFGVASTDPGYGSITLPTITASITDNDSAVVSFAPASVSQSEGTSPMAYTVTLSAPVASGVIVKVNSADGTATAGADYTAVADQTVSFAANSTTAQTVNVAVSNDALDEDNETYTLTLSGLSATGDVTLGTATATGTIEDDDALPVLSVANVTQPEGNAANTLSFTVNLSPVSGRAVSFTRATVDGSAVSTGLTPDFAAIAASTVTIPAGQTSLTIPVTINGDATFEGDEQFALSLTAVSNATPGTLNATATLTEDDQQPTTTTIATDLPDPSVVGQGYPVSVEVRAQTLSPLGTVSITDGTGASCTGPLSTGTPPLSTMSCTLTSTSAGTKTLTASYTPASSAFGESSDTEAHTVNAASTSLVLLGPARARIGTAATYTAELSVTAPGSGTPAGTVTVSAGSNSCTITYPTATPSCTITYSSLGSRTVTATFAPGNGNYLGSTATPVQTLVFASSDVSVTKTNAVNTYRPGDLLVYTVIVRNSGPDAAPQVRIRDVAPAGLTNVAWTCEAGGGAVCPDSGGTGTLDHVVATLPSSGTLTYAYFGNVTGRPLSIVNVAEVTLPADTTIEDPNLANNTASDTDLLDDLFADGFEAPGINSETGGVRLAGASLRSTGDAVARVTVRLSDVRGEALRVYTRVIGGELQVALAVRGSDGSLRLGAWQQASGEPELVWTATPAAGGYLLSGASLR